MSGFSTLPGSFVPIPLNAIDYARTNAQDFDHAPNRTNGVYMLDAFVANPTNVDEWRILAFTVQCQIALFTADPTFKWWARLGKLWAGVIVNPSELVTARLNTFRWPPAKFPSDLSNFTVIWDGSNDPISLVDNTTSQVDDNYTIVAQSFQLPFPPTIRSGTQLAFALILTPSVLDPVIAIWIRNCTYSIVYETHDTRRR